MKKRMLLLIGCLLLLSTLFCLPCMGAADSDQTVFDDAALLTPQAIENIEKTARSARETCDCDFYIATYRTPQNTVSYGYQFQYTGEAFLSDYGLSARSNIVLLILTLDNGTYYYDMYTYGDAYSRIGQKEVDYILDDDSVFDNIKAGHLEDGACAFLQLSAKAYRGRVGVSYWVIVPVTFIISALIGIGVCAGVKVKYSMKMKSVDYPLNRFAKLELTEQNDVFKGSFVTKRIIESNPGGGGGGGSSHGGGGGHRGGR